MKGMLNFCPGMYYMYIVDYNRTFNAMSSKQNKLNKYM